MEMQVQYLNRMVLMVVLAIMCGCSNSEHEKVTTRNKWYDMARHNLSTKAGVTYMDGNICSGQVYRLFANGDTATIARYIDGKKQGQAKEWYSNGQIKDIRNYEQGRYTGEQQGWYEDGQLKYIYHYNNGVYDGNVKEWFASGLLYKDFNYINGQEQGMQRMYWDDGKIRANYEVKNGRKYGLTGVKNCASQWSDLTADL